MTFLRRLLLVSIVAVLPIWSVPTLAQDTASTAESVDSGSTAFASGLGSPATLFDERGNAFATVTVTSIERDWEKHDNWDTPDAGKMFVLLTLEHTNLGNRPMEVAPHNIHLLDNYGARAELDYYGDVDVTTDPITVAAGETEITKTVHIMWSDTEPTLVMYQPIYNIHAFLHVGGESTGDSAFVSGMGVPATAFDERGNPISDLAVTDVEIDWDGYDENYAPPTSMIYVRITIEHTNLSSRPLEIQPFGIQMVDSFGIMAPAAYYYADDAVTVDPITLEPGETGTTYSLFSIWPDATPMIVMYSPMYTFVTTVHLGE